ncbi:MAG: hypothetical protein AMXMBFR44_0870 [Candidatus Campbellbacteria bacterium]
MSVLRDHVVETLMAHRSQIRRLLTIMTPNLPRRASMVRRINTLINQKELSPEFGVGLKMVLHARIPSGARSLVELGRTARQFRHLLEATDQSMQMTKKVHVLKAV